MWTGIISFFVNIADSIGGWLKKISDGLTWMSTQRMFLVASVTASVKVIYDFTISSIDEALLKVETVNSATAVTGQITVFSMMEFANSIVPISEIFALMVALLEFWLACTLVKMILCFVPTIK